MHVFFDLDDTLFNHRDAQARAVMAWRRQHLPEVSLSDAELVAVWESSTIRYYRQFERGEISFQDQLRRRVRSVATDRILSDADAEELFRAYQPHYEKFWSLFADVRPCLEQLSTVSLGILAHGDPEQQKRKLALFDMAGLFEPVVIADEFSPRKPSTEFFELATKACGVTAEECVYVGDHLQLDALGAKNAGWRGIWLERSGVFTVDLGVDIVRSLSELPAALGH